MTVLRTIVDLTDTTLPPGGLDPDSPDDQTAKFKALLALLVTGTGPGAYGTVGRLPRGIYYVKGTILSRTRDDSNVTLEGDGADASIIARFPDLLFKVGSNSIYTDSLLSLPDLLSTATPWVYSSPEIQISGGDEPRLTVLPVIVASSSSTKSQLKVHYKTYSPGFIGGEEGSKFVITVDAADNAFGEAPTGADVSIELSSGAHTIKFALVDGAASGLAIGVDSVRITNARVPDDAYYIGHVRGEANLALQTLLTPTTAWNVSSSPASERGDWTLNVDSTGSTSTKSTTTPSFQCASDSVLKFSMRTFSPGFMPVQA